ncbi:hypothetical protein [Rhodococcus opacus]|uniref:Hypothetical membrane protein n=1 Tax=Rhodococcus opacus (strain B4) TaxID=632772 RepID=C1B2G5_RHOOB|nr:hypothetical protein [Rhodococcus opacus]BAH50589.1 hypothetical membrane protein [Rhodococcus opacus B4]
MPVGGCFVAALDRIGIPGTANLLNLVILVVVLSVFNSGCVMLAALFPDTVFLFLINASGGVPVRVLHDLHLRTAAAPAVEKGRTQACSSSGCRCTRARRSW